MKACCARLALFFLILIAIAGRIAGQQQPICNVTCEPNPASPSFTGGTIQARSLSSNSRGRASVFDSITAASAPSDRASNTSVLTGSQSYDYDIPIMMLPGRNNLNVVLNLHYNSHLWTSAQLATTFNADRDFPSYGFRIGYGFVEGPFTNAAGTSSYQLIEPDGTKRELRLASGSVYNSVDSSYIDFNSSTLVLRRKDGTQWQYQQAGATTVYRPTVIKDTNGNELLIGYHTESGFSNLAISTITDTVNRVVTFNYDANQKLVSIGVQAPGGQSRVFATFTWAQATLNYNFVLSVKDSPPSGTVVNVLSGCTYPSGLAYSFSYGDWGIVNQITLTSAAGKIRSYVRYDYPLASESQSSPTFQHQYLSGDGTSENAWTYQATKTGSQVSGMAVTDPLGTTTTTNLFTSSWQTGLPSSVVIQNGATTLKTSTLDWTQDDTTLSYSLNPQLIRVTTTLGDSQQKSKTEVDHDSNGNIVEERKFDYGLTLIRRHDWTYLTQASYINAHILDRAAGSFIYDKNGNLVERTNYGYDESMLTSVTGAAQHDDIGYATTFLLRGNLTSTTQYTNAATGSGPIVHSMTYDSLGNELSSQPDCCQLLQQSFGADNQFAYPEVITTGTGAAQLTTSRTYDLLTGLTISDTDENQQTTTYSYDVMGRPTLRTLPGNITSTVQYDDASAVAGITTTAPTDASHSIVNIAQLDGLNHVTQQEVQDQAANSYSLVQTQYDALGRVAQSSMPFARGNSPLWTVFSYDGLDRTRAITPPGNSGSYQFSYSGNATTESDPAGQSRILFADALNRLVEVREPGFDDGAAGSCSVTIQGTDSGEVIENTCCVGHSCRPCNSVLWDTGDISITVNGYVADEGYGRLSTPSSIAAAFASTFNSDTASPVSAVANSNVVTLTAKIGGLTSNYPVSAASASSNPAVFGKASFTASPSGASLTGGTDGTGADGHPATLATPALTDYAYDPLDHLVHVQEGQQQRSYIFDSAGRMTSSTAPESGSVNYTYNNFGLVTQRQDARGALTNYSYDGLNRPTQITYSVANTSATATPATTLVYGTSSALNNNGRLITRNDGAGSESLAYDALGRITSRQLTIGGSIYNIQYQYNLAGQIASTTYPSGRQIQIQRDAIGRMTQILNGGANVYAVSSYGPGSQPLAGSFGNGITAAFAYNSLQQLSSLSYSEGASTLFSLTYGYGTGNNGQVQSVTDNVDSTRSTTLSYDALGHLATASNAQWGLAWTYDRYGNRRSQAVTSGTGPSLQVLPDPATNRLLDAAYGFDASGNLTSDGVNQLAYDAEGRVTQNTANSQVSSYTYDGLGRRATKSSGGTSTAYIYSDSDLIAEYPVGGAASAPLREYVYDVSNLLATIQSEATNYHLRDQLSPRMTASSTGVVIGVLGHFPFGESWYDSGTTTTRKFTSYQRDSESGNDYAMTRIYISRLGRFSSPDSVDGDISTPQTLNRYAYVNNSPLQFVDPTGRDTMPPDCDQDPHCGDRIPDPMPSAAPESPDPTEAPVAPAPPQMDPLMKFSEDWWLNFYSASNHGTSKDGDPTSVLGDYNKAFDRALFGIHYYELPSLNSREAEEGLYRYLSIYVAYLTYLRSVGSPSPKPNLSCDPEFDQNCTIVKVPVTPDKMPLKPLKLSPPPPMLLPPAACRGLPTFDAIRKCLAAFKH